MTTREDLENRKLVPILTQEIAELKAELAKFKEVPRNGWDGSYALDKIPTENGLLPLYYKEGE